MFHPLGFFAEEGFASRLSSAGPLLSCLQLIYVAVRAVTGMVNHGLCNHFSPWGSAQSEQLHKPPPKLSFSWMRILHINFEIITKPD